MIYLFYPGKKSFYLLCVAVIMSLSSYAQSSADIVPLPVSSIRLEGKSFKADNSTIILYDSVFHEQAVYAADLIGAQCKIRMSVLPSSSGYSGTSIRLLYDTSGANRPEMYILTCSDTVVSIKAADIQGMVHGLQSLIQLLPLKHLRSVYIEPVMITDYPHFSYRGMHLDVSRHFFPLDFLKEYIDYLAFHKLNTFHWHLSDDQGWRIEIKSYPRLTSVGAWRNATLIGHFRDTPARYDSSRYGGYYTQEEARELVRYAAVRGITIIPEIDIPGHSRAIIAAYPEFSTRPDTTWEVATTWGMFNRQNNVLAPSPATFRFLESMYDEICQIFPSPYIHVGGDECSKIWWQASEATQQFIRENDLKDEKGLQTYFIQQAASYMKKNGKKIISWHDVLEGNPDTSTLIMNWKGDAEALAAVAGNYKVIMTPGHPWYFDHYQTKSEDDSLAIHRYNPLDAVYNYYAVPYAVDSMKLGHHILGGQANVWTEYMGNIPKVQHMIFPRMTALSEALWTAPAQKDFNAFKKRLKKAIIPRYLLWKSNYCRDYEQWTIEQK